MTKPKTKTPANAASSVKSTAKITLTDLNDDPSRINDLSKADVIRLHNEAEKGEIALGGNTRGILNQLFNVHTGGE